MAGNPFRRLPAEAQRPSRDSDNGSFSMPLDQATDGKSQYQSGMRGRSQLTNMYGSSPQGLQE